MITGDDPFTEPAEPPSRAPRRRLSTRVLWPALVAVVMLAFAYNIVTLSYRAYLRGVKMDTTLELVEVRARIEAEILGRILKLNQFATVIAENPEMTQEDFSTRATEFLLAHPEVINIAAAPDQVVKMVFPVAPNESVIGFDYRTNAEQYPKVAEALRNGEGLLTGPVDLIQGGRGLILRKPVFIHDNDHPDAVWGLLSVVMDYDRFLADLGIPEIQERYDILIRELGSNAAVPQVLLGDPALLDQNPIRLDFNFPFGQWEFAATQAGGWPRSQPGSGWRWLLRFTMVALCLFGLSYVMRLADTRRSAEYRLFTGIEALNHGFVMFDSAGHLVAHNRRYQTMHEDGELVSVGTSYEEIVRAGIARGTVPEAVGREDEWFAEWIEGMARGSSETEQHLADGRVIKTSDRRMADGSIVGLRIDVSDLKEAQRAAEAANKAKTDFMGVLSHELRTPLTVILGHARLGRMIANLPAAKALDKHVVTSPDLAADLQALYDRIGEMMRKVEQSGEHLLTLINEILDFAKIDSGSLSVKPEPLNVTDIVGPVADQMRPMIEEKGLTFEVDGIDTVLNADGKRIGQVLINLVANAVKFTDAGSVRLSVVDCGKYVEFRVSDTGIGIPEDQLARVFEAFHQVDASPARRFGGTGLGLAISRDIATAHGGTLRAESVLGKGSTFVLSLPHAAHNSTEAALSNHRVA